MYEEPKVHVKEITEQDVRELQGEATIAGVGLVLIFMAFLGVLGFGLLELLAG